MKNSLLMIFDKIPCTIVQGVLSKFGAILKSTKHYSKNLWEILEFNYFKGPFGISNTINLN